MTSSMFSRLTKSKCILLLQHCKSVKEVKQIQTQIFRIGLSQNRDAVNKLLVFCTNPNSGNLPYAETIFNYIQDPWLFIYNLMIKAFTKNGCLRKAVLLFTRLREDGLSPDNFTYPFVLKAVGSLGLVLEGRKIHCFITKTGLEYESFVRNSLMDMYAEMSNTETLAQLFEEMSDRDVVCWNILISGYVRCGRFEDAVNVFQRMKAEYGVKPDEATLVSTLSACVALRDLELGKELHHYVYQELEFTTVLGNALLNMYAKCGSVSQARRIFDGMLVKNVISWTSIVSGYVNNGQLNEARDLFESSPVRDVVLWTTMINGYVQFNRFDEALVLFQEMQIRKVKPDKFTVVALLTCCAQLGALEQGRWLHGYIEENKLRMDAIVGTALIDMYAKCGCIDKSLEIFSRVDDKDRASWTAIVCGLAMNGQTSKALEMFLKMKQAEVRPDDITFIGVLCACSHAGLVEEGLWYFESMKNVYNIEPKLEHYGCLVDLLGRAGLLDEAESMLVKIPYYTDDDLLPLWSALLGACRIHGNVEMCERVAKRLSGRLFGNSGIHTIVANIYAAANKWEDVNKVRRKMKDLGVKKIPGCSSIEVNGIIHEFVVRDSSHPEMSKIYSTLTDMSRTLSGCEEIDKVSIHLL